MHRVRTARRTGSGSGSTRKSQRRNDASGNGMIHSPRPPKRKPGKPKPQQPDGNSNNDEKGKE